MWYIINMKRKIIVSLIMFALSVSLFCSLFFDTKLEIFFKLQPDMKGLNNDSFAVHFIDVGQGDAIAIRFPNNKTMLIDSGPAYALKDLNEYLDRIFFKDDYNTFDYVFLTHSDVDHTGLLDCFDANYMSKTCLQNFCLEQKGEKNFREQNPLHEPYCILSKVISNYQSPNLEKCFSVAPHARKSEVSENIPALDKKYFSYEGSVFIKNYEFLFFEGKGGHVQGETIILCPKLKLLFTGDIFVNIKGFSAEQKEFNTLAPFLMTGVDQNPQLAKEERDYLKTFFTEYTICPGHGAIVHPNE